MPEARAAPSRTHEERIADLERAVACLEHGVANASLAERTAITRVLERAEEESHAHAKDIAGAETANEPCEGTPTFDGGGC